MNRLQILSVGLLMSIFGAQTCFGMEKKLNRYFNYRDAINTEEIAVDLGKEFGVNPEAIRQPLDVTLKLDTSKIQYDRQKSGAIGALATLMTMCIANVLFPEEMHTVQSSKLASVLFATVLGYLIYQVYGSLEYYHTPKEALARAIYDESTKGFKKNKKAKLKKSKNGKEKEKGAESDEESDNAKSNKDELLDSISAPFNKFKKSLTLMQKQSLDKATRLKKDPKKLLKEPAFLKQLNPAQDKELAELLEIVASDKAKKGFSKFAKKINAVTVGLLSSNTKLLLAQFAPSVLNFETEFIDALNKNKLLAKEFENLCNA